MESALELFGASGYDAVSVSAIAARAGVTTGPLYHHFGDKAGLYRLVRSDVERRVVDRFETAATLLPVRQVADLTPVLLAGFDYLVTSRLTHLLAEPPPRTTDPVVDPVEHQVDHLLPGPAPLGYLVAALWRAALLRVSTRPDAADQARRDLTSLLTR